jgi:hypothetical protein
MRQKIRAKSGRVEKNDNRIHQNSKFPLHLKHKTIFYQIR